MQSTIFTFLKDAIYFTIFYAGQFFTYAAWPFQYCITKYPLYVGYFVGVLATLAYVKLLYYPADLTWLGFMVDLIDKIITSVDNYFEYKPTELPNPVDNSAKIYNFSKKAFVWAVVGGFAAYSGLYLVGLSFGLNKLFLMHIVPYMTIQISPKILDSITVLPDSTSLFYLNWF